jgi:hypothetical protein
MSNSLSFLHFFFLFFFFAKNSVRIFGSTFKRLLYILRTKHLFGQSASQQGIPNCLIDTPCTLDALCTQYFFDTFSKIFKPVLVKILSRRNFWFKKLTCAFGTLCPSCLISSAVEGWKLRRIQNVRVRSTITFSFSESPSGDLVKIVKWPPGGGVTESADTQISCD